MDRRWFHGYYAKIKPRSSALCGGEIIGRFLFANYKFAPIYSGIANTGEREITSFISTNGTFSVSVTEKRNYFTTNRDFFRLYAKKLH